MGDDFPLFDMRVYGEAIADFIVRLRDDEAFRQGLLEKMQRVLEAHRDGYATAAREVIKLCTAPAKMGADEPWAAKAQNRLSFM